MVKQIQQCVRMGISPKWTTYKTVLKRIATVYSKVDMVAFRLNLIREYVAREDSAPTKLIPNRRNVTSATAKDLGCDRVLKLLGAAPSTPQWLEDIAPWMRYYQVGMRQDYYWHYRYDILFKEVNRRSLRMYNIYVASNMMAVLSILGWKDAVIYQGYLTHAALNRQYQLVLQYTEEHYRAQAFMLRLFADWVGDVSHAWLDYAYDEPIYEALLQHWRTPNPEDLVPCLLAACDRHTHQTGRNSEKVFYDYNHLSYLERVPVEILFIFRLREWEGLQNPTLDHPIMASPFNKLPLEQPVPELDDLLQQVVARAQQDWADYETELSLPVLKTHGKG